MSGSQHEDAVVFGYNHQAVAAGQHGHHAGRGNDVIPVGMNFVAVDQNGNACAGGAGIYKM